MKSIKKFHVSRIQIIAGASTNPNFKSQTVYSTKNRQGNESLTETEDTQSTIRIRPSTPKINLLRQPSNKSTAINSTKDFTELIDDILANNSNDDPASALCKALTQMLDIKQEELLQLKKIAFTIDTSRHNLQAIGECLPNLSELKLNTSKINCLRDIGTSFSGLKILWISRVGLNDLSGNSMNRHIKFPNAGGIVRIL